MQIIYWARDSVQHPLNNIFFLIIKFSMVFSNDLIVGTGTFPVAMHMYAQTTAYRMYVQTTAIHSKLAVKH